MPLFIAHPFVSQKSNGSDSSLVRPSDWNANHAITGGATIVYSVTLTGNQEITHAAPTADGQTLLVIISQDSSGSHTITWDTMFSLVSPSIPPDVSTVNVFSFVGVGSSWYLSCTPILGATL